MIVIDGCIRPMPQLRKARPQSPRCETELPEVLAVPLTSGSKLARLRGIGILNSQKVDQRHAAGTFP
jgi:hypothetical protein